MGLDKQILSYYDDPTADDDDVGFILGVQGKVNYEQEKKIREEKKILGSVPLGGITLYYEKTKEMADFYTKEEVLAFKKPKKKKKASRKRKTLSDDEVNAVNAVDDAEMTMDGPIIHESFSNSNKTKDIGATNFVDDDDLQALLAQSRKKANNKNNIALRVLEEAAEEAAYIKEDEDIGLVISDLTEFVGTLSGTSALLPKPSASKSNDIVNIAQDETNDHKASDFDMEIEKNEEELEEGEEVEEEDHIDVRIVTLDN